MARFGGAYGKDTHHGGVWWNKLLIWPEREGETRSLGPSITFKAMPAVTQLPPRKTPLLNISTPSRCQGEDQALGDSQTPTGRL